METVGRVALASDPKFELAAKHYELKRLDRQINLAIKIDNIKDGYFKNSAINDLEQLTGRKFPKSIQEELFK